MSRVSTNTGSLSLASRSFFVWLVVVACVAAAPAAADFRLEQTLSIDPGGTLDLETDGGRVEIRGSSRSDVFIVVTSEDEDIEDRYDFEFTEGGTRATVRVKRRGPRIRRWFGWGSSPHFEVEVPRQSDLRIRSSGGRISVDTLDGIANLHTSGGRIDIKSVTGEVDASTSGGAISAVDLGAAAKLATSGGSIAVESIAGALNAKTSGGGIRIKEAGDVVYAHTSGGSVSAYFSAGNDAGGSLSSSGGRVMAYVDPSAALDVDASTSGGGVTVDLPVTVQGRISRNSVRGTLNGGGELLKIRSSGGGVGVKPL